MPANVTLRLRISGIDYQVYFPDSDHNLCVALLDAGMRHEAVTDSYVVDLIQANSLDYPAEARALYRCST